MTALPGGGTAVVGMVGEIVSLSCFHLANFHDQAGCVKLWRDTLAVADDEHQLLRPQKLARSRRSV
jgi:hypothetical protein